MAIPPSRGMWGLCVAFFFQSCCTILGHWTCFIFFTLPCRPHIWTLFFVLLTQCSKHTNDPRAGAIVGAYSSWLPFAQKAASTGQGRGGLTLTGALYFAPPPPSQKKITEKLNDKMIDSLSKYLTSRLTFIRIALESLVLEKWSVQTCCTLFFRSLYPVKSLSSSLNQSIIRRLHSCFLLIENKKLFVHEMHNNIHLLQPQLVPLQTHCTQ